MQNSVVCVKENVQKLMRIAPTFPTSKYGWKENKSQNAETVFFASSFSLLAKLLLSFQRNSKSISEATTEDSLVSETVSSLE